MLRPLRLTGLTIATALMAGGLSASGLLSTSPNAFAATALPQSGTQSDTTCAGPAPAPAAPGITIPGFPGQTAPIGAPAQTVPCVPSIDPGLLPGGSINPAAQQAQDCQAVIAATEQAMLQESTEKLLSEFLNNLIGNDAQRWSSAVSTAGYQGATPPATSALVSDAVNQVAGINYDAGNSLSEALKSMLDAGTDLTADCGVDPSDEAEQVKDDTLSRLAEQDDGLDWVEQALNQVAGVVAGWSQEGLSPDESYHAPGSSSTSF
jgi:hypothetical protein